MSQYVDKDEAHISCISTGCCAIFHECSIPIPVSRNRFRIKGSLHFIMLRTSEKDVSRQPEMIPNFHTSTRPYLIRPLSSYFLTIVSCKIQFASEFADFCAGYHPITVSFDANMRQFQTNNTDRLLLPHLGKLRTCLQIQFPWLQFLAYNVQ